MIARENQEGGGWGSGRGSRDVSRGRTTEGVEGVSVGGRTSVRGFCTGGRSPEGTPGTPGGERPNDNPPTGGGNPTNSLSLLKPLCMCGLLST